jgi:uncharacterized OB-fold protein
MAREGEGVTFTAPHIVEYAYRRSVGAVLSRFFTGLRERKLVGSRTRGGRVLVPPCEYDPETGESVTEIVDVGPGGVVTSWAWVHKPSAKHPLAHPFAWALVRLDGADTGMLHAVDAGSESRMQTGMRVQPRWRKQTAGEIRDIECFEPEAAR